MFEAVLRVITEGQNVDVHWSYQVTSQARPKDHGDWTDLLIAIPSYSELHQESKDKCPWLGQAGSRWTQIHSLPIPTN